MKVRVDIIIPDDNLVSEPNNVSRQVLEQFAIEAYKSGQFSEAQVRRFLEFPNRMDVHGFLKEHNVSMYTEEDLEKDLKTLDKWRGVS